MRNTIKILGVKIDNITLDEAGQITKRLINESNKTCKMVFAPNVEIVMAAQKNKEFCEILNKSSLSTPDSVRTIDRSKDAEQTIKRKNSRTSIF